MKKIFFIFTTLFSISFHLHAMDYKKLAGITTNTFGGKINQPEQYININQQDPFTKKTFADLIKEQRTKELPYLIAVTTEIKKRTVGATTPKEIILRFQDAHSLNNYLFNDNFTRTARHTHPLNCNYLDSIRYYEITSINDEAFLYLCNEQDLNQHDDYGKFWKTYMDANRGYADKQFKLGRIYFNLKKYALAEPYLKKVADNSDNPKSLKAQFSLGIVYCNLQKPDLADLYLKKAADNPDNPKSLNAHYALGRIHFNRNQYDLAEPYLKKVVDTPDHQDSLNAHYVLGCIHVIREQFDLAELSLKKVADTPGHPKSLQAHYLLGFSYSRLKQFDLAELYLKKVTDTPDAPNSPQAQFHLGYIKEHFHDFEAAITWYKKAAQSSDIFAILNIFYLLHEHSTLTISQEETDNYYAKLSESTADIENYKQDYPERWKKIQETIKTIATTNMAGKRKRADED